MDREVEIDPGNFFQVVYPIDGKGPDASNYVMRALTAQIADKLATDAFNSKLRTLGKDLSDQEYFDMLVENLHERFQNENISENPAIVIQVHGADPEEVCNLVKHTTKLYNERKCPRFYFLVSGHGARKVEGELNCKAFDAESIGLHSLVGFDENDNPSYVIAGNKPPSLW
jgi:hypothetical protein